MSVRISSRVSTIRSSEIPSTGSRQDPAMSGAAAEAGQGLDRVRVGTAAQLLALSSTGEDIRAEKVAPVKAALEAGVYGVESSEVASAVVTSMLDDRR